LLTQIPLVDGDNDASAFPAGIPEFDTFDREFNACFLLSGVYDVDHQQVK
jgi:hypothetical protein